jgi:hypothetical protein
MSIASLPVSRAPWLVFRETAGGSQTPCSALLALLRCLIGDEKGFIICDDISVSPTENGVFTLEGVRQHLEAAYFPWCARLSLFLLLFSPRKGKYSGKILIVNERSERPIRYVKFLATFQQVNELLPLYVEVGECVFSEAGPYSFEIYFSARGGDEVLKGEHPFTVLSCEE